MDEFDNIDQRRDEREAESIQGSNLYHDPPDYSQMSQSQLQQSDPDNFAPYDQSSIAQNPSGGSVSGSPDSPDAPMLDPLPPMQQSMADELGDIDGQRNNQDNPNMQGGDPAQQGQGGAPKGKGKKGKPRPKLQQGRGAANSRQPRKPTERQLNKALATGDFSGLDLRGDFSRYKSLAHMRNPDGTLTARDLVSPEAQRRHQMHMRGLNQPPQGGLTPQQHEARIRQVDQMLQRRGINLSNSHLGGANLSNMNLNNSQMRVNLAGANLQQANLKGTDLSGQSLEHANLQHANLTNVKLNQAELRDANLQGARLIGANLRNARNAPQLDKNTPSFHSRR